MCKTKFLSIIEWKPENIQLFATSSEIEHPQLLIKDFTQNISTLSDKTRNFVP